jgi:signal transduction histidine kinase
LKHEASCAVTAHLPITERKLVEQQLVDSERLAAIGQAMRGLSHEGCNTLQRAQGCIDLLRSHVEHDRDALQLIERIENSQRHLLDLYEEVKSYAAPITLNVGRYRLDEIVEEVWSIFQSRPIPAKLSHREHGTDLTCIVDVAAISEVLKLIFDNALTTGARAPEIQVSYADTEIDCKPAITIIVDDNGPGLGPGDNERAFDPFYTTKQRGTGLGLAICKRIVLAHGGRILFDTRRHEGASVRITLPAAT